MLDRELEIDTLILQHLKGDHQLDQLARELLQAGGKRLRAKLALTLARMLGVPPEAAVPWAAANELLHNASLIHDDIQDGDLWRRGKPTMWAKHGLDVAISAGDYLLMKPFLIIAQMPVSAEERLELTRWTAEAVSVMAIAQVQERALREKLGDASIRLSYLEVIQGKTSALFELPVRGLALMACWSDDEMRNLILSFRCLGEYFQILDDLKDVTGAKGKPRRGEDLREGKVSAISAMYAEREPERAVELARFLKGAKRDDAAIEYWLKEFERSGAVDLTVRWLSELWTQFEQLLPPEFSKLGLNDLLMNWLGITPSQERPHV